MDRSQKMYENLQQSSWAQQNQAPLAHGTPQQGKPDTPMVSIDRSIAMANERLMKDLIFLREALDRINGSSPPRPQEPQGPAAVPNGAIEAIQVRLNETFGLLEVLSELAGRANALA
jgi:hypothetical protein